MPRERHEEELELLREPYRAYLEHQIRLWGAEEENARRLARREALLLTVSFGFFGVVLLRFGLASADFQERLSELPTGLLYLEAISLVLGLSSLAVSCLYLFDWMNTIRQWPACLVNWLLRIRDRLRKEHPRKKMRFWRRSTPPASFLLQLQESDIKAVNADLRFLQTDEEAASRDFVELANYQMLRQGERYYGAVEELVRRNTREQGRIKTALRWFLPGVGGIMFAVVLWLCGTLGVVQGGRYPAFKGREVANGERIGVHSEEPAGGVGEGVEPDGARGAEGPDGEDQGSEESSGSGKQPVEQQAAEKE